MRLVIHLGRDDIADNKGDPGIEMVILRPFPQPLRAQADPFRTGDGADNGPGLRRQRQGNLPHFRAQIGQGLRGGGYRIPGLGIQPQSGIHQFSNQAHFDAAEVSGQGIPIVGDGNAAGIGVLRVIAGNGPESKGGVGHGAGYGADGVNRPASPIHAVAADPAPSGPQAGQAAVGRRAANGAAGILAQGSGAKKAGGSRPGAGAGSAGIPFQIPGIAGRAIVGTDGIAHSELAHIELAQQDGPGLPQAGHYRGIGLRDKVGPDFRGVAGEDSPGVDLILDRYRDAVERPAILPPGDFRPGLAGFLPGGRGANGDIGIEPGIHLLNARQVGVHRFQRRYFFGGDKPAQLGSGQIGDFSGLHR